MEALAYSTVLARLAQIPRLRRRHIADTAWAVAIGTRDKPQKHIQALERA